MHAKEQPAQGVAGRRRAPNPPGQAAVVVRPALGTTSAPAPVRPRPPPESPCSSWFAVVGRSDPAINAPSHAYLWTNGKMTDLGTLGGTFSQASAVNDHGLVIGTSLTAAGTTDGFAWAGGHISALAVDGATARPIGVNERDQVILTTGAAAQPGQPATTLGWLWRAGQRTALGTLGGQSATPTDIDNVGAVFGASDLASGDTHAALWLPRL
ncbi:hypothetical protein [Frankia sp. AgKG'84/4]|uniref:hypothetical protein n=1 Tax=Frankia sp. AgKG'84/4 TaxID=573490 RepID=UPI00200C35D9|nr:hypothetical protein [Frankia sp. AgKG'84/4]MCL9795487.1 hypothetical protein [Frankia sp. AgKG'84/4]